MSQIKNSPDEFSQQIALECQKLDAIFSQETFNYHNTASLQGKSWFSIGLENNDNDQQKDNGNKANVIKRMVDAIVGFIKKIIEKIKSLFGKHTPEQVKENEQVFKTYQGPSDDAMADTVKDFMNSMRGDEEHHSSIMEKMRKDSEEHAKNMAESEKKHKEFMDRADKMKKDQAQHDAKMKEMRNALNKGSAALDEILNDLQNTTGKPLSDGEITEIIEETIGKKLVSKIRSDMLTFFVAMMDDKFHTAYAELLSKAGAVVTKSPGSDFAVNYQEAAEEIKQLSNTCFNIMEQSKRWDSKELEETATKLAMGDIKLTSYTQAYFVDTEGSLKAGIEYMFKLEKEVEKLKNDSSPETISILKDTQSLLFAITRYQYMVNRVRDTANQVASALKSLDK